MALAFPTPLANFFSTLPIKSAMPDLMEDVELNWNGYGELLTADQGDRLWKMDLTLLDDRYDMLEGVRARLNVYRQAGRSFLAHAMPIYYPQADPDGAVLGARVPRLASVAANMRDITLTNLPNGYALTAGDFLSFTYSTNPTRYAFHQIVNSGAASSSGVTGQLEVVPEIRPGYSLNVDVTLIRPFFKAIIVPRTVLMGSSTGLITRGMGLTLQQTLR